MIITFFLFFFSLKKIKMENGGMCL